MKKLAWWHTQKDLMKQFREMGLTRNEITELKKMDRDEVIKEFERILGERRTELQTSGADANSRIPTIGKEIRWIDIVKMVFRVLDFDRNNTTINLDEGPQSAKPKSAVEPYGYLLVESPTLNQPVRLPIVHNNDFWLASSRFDDPAATQWMSHPELIEMLVTYAPKKMSKEGFNTSSHHPLHFTLAPAGTLEGYYTDNTIGDKRMSTPEPHRIFGSFIYDGEVSVGFNENPEI